MTADRKEVQRQMALDYHQRTPPGKIEVVASKPCATQHDLSLAYTPGVAVPCLEIADDPPKAALYTARANLIGVITNGTAVLGLGDIGPLASKPVMEGKGVLFKRFAGIDVFDIELDCKDPDQFVELVAALEPTFGGINLEDIKAPECFAIEERLRERMNIPVFHDDQHGTAIIVAAALLNAAEISKRQFHECRVVFSGAGAAAVSCGKLLVDFGIPWEQIVFCDKVGILNHRRDDLGDLYKPLLRDTKARNLGEAMRDADVFIGLSAGGIVSAEMVQGMADDPIVFALANPTPEIAYPSLRAARDDVIAATGRSDYPNQVNNVLGFPYIFRGALDCGATTVNLQMKMAAARALARLARENVPDSVREAYGKRVFEFGRDYLIPKPLDHRVLLWVAPAVAQAAAETGVASRPIGDLDEYRQQLASFLGRRRELMASVSARAAADKRRIVFPEGDKNKVLRACHELLEKEICQPVVLGTPDAINAAAERAGVTVDGVEIVDPKASEHYQQFVESYFELRKRRGVTMRSALIDMSDRVRFGMMLVREGHADGLVCGLSMNYAETIRPALQIIGLSAGVAATAGMYMILLKSRTLFFADTTVNIEPNAETLAEIAILTAAEVRKFDLEPRVAMISFSNFGSNNHRLAQKVKQATEIVRSREPGLKIDGEMQVDTAVDEELATEEFPFSSILGDANILVFPSLEAANTAYKLMARLGGAEAVGPILLGMNRSVNVLPRGATAEDVFNIAAYTALRA